MTAPTTDDAIVEAVRNAIRPHMRLDAHEEQKPFSERVSLRQEIAALLTERVIGIICAAHPGIAAVLAGEAVCVPARGGITPAMEVAADDEMMQQYRDSDWEDAKDMAEGLNLRAIYRAAALCSPYAAPTP